jgi:hypothetical protein
MLLFILLFFTGKLAQLKRPVQKWRRFGRANNKKKFLSGIGATRPALVDRRRPTPHAVHCLLESNNFRGFEYRVGEKNVIWERGELKKKK